jgi:hypothetical protein
MSVDNSKDQFTDREPLPASHLGLEAKIRIIVVFKFGNVPALHNKSIQINEPTNARIKSVGQQAQLGKIKICGFVVELNDQRDVELLERKMLKPRMHDRKLMIKANPLVEITVGELDRLITDNLQRCIPGLDLIRKTQKVSGGDVGSFQLLLKRFLPSQPNFARAGDDRHAHIEVVVIDEEYAHAHLINCRTRGVVFQLRIRCVQSLQQCQGHSTFGGVEAVWL